MERLLQQRTVALSVKSLKLAAALQYLHLKPSCTVPPLIQHHGDDDDDISGDDMIQKMFSDGLFSTFQRRQWRTIFLATFSAARLLETIGNYWQSQQIQSWLSQRTMSTVGNCCQLFATCRNWLLAITTDCFSSNPKLTLEFFNCQINIGPQIYVSYLLISKKEWENSGALRRRWRTLCGTRRRLRRSPEGSKILRSTRWIYLLIHQARVIWSLVNADWKCSLLLVIPYSDARLYGAFYQWRHFYLQMSGTSDQFSRKKIHCLED